MDIGVYNFVKNALAQGQSKEAISSGLAASRMGQTDIDVVFAAVAAGAVPTASAAIPLQPVATTMGTVYEKPNSLTRPDILSAICGYYFISIVLGFLSIATAYATPGSIHANFSLTYIVIDAAFFARAVGMWQMQKWGVYLFAAAALLNAVINFATAPFGGIGAIIFYLFQIGVLYVGFKYLSEMN